MTETEIEMGALTGITSQRYSHWVMVFKKYDTDQDGKINLTELESILHSHDGKEFSAHEVDRIMTIADKNESGHLDYEEFVNIMQKPDQKWAFGRFVDIYIRFVLALPPLKHVNRTGRMCKKMYNCWPPPIYMIIISVLQITLFSIDASSGYLQAEGKIAKIFIYHPMKRAEVYPFLTYMFVHVGWCHLVSNLLMQILVGFSLESVHGWRIILIYLSGVIAGSLVHGLVETTRCLAGASAGVYALCSAHIASFILNTLQNSSEWRPKRRTIFDKKNIRLCLQILLFLILVGAEFVLAVSAIIPHGAGAVTGLLLGIGILRNLDVRKCLKVTAVIVTTVCMVGCALAHIFWTTRFSKNVTETFTVI